MAVNKCLVPVRHGVILNIRQVASPLKRLVDRDEKIFDKEKSFNYQNAVYTQGMPPKNKERELRAMISSPVSLIVWWCVKYEGVSGIYFCKKGVKTTFTCRNCGGGDRGRVAIYRPFGEVSLSLKRIVTCMVLKANDRRTSCLCHDEFRGPRSDYVRQVALATNNNTVRGSSLNEFCVT
ncbi:uncharacterized protein TNCV_4330481 [Trichonephila clavipes]|nr:uncharacterized protein TNCV_4330481 [Trichonephila clavipes]